MERLPRVSVIMAAYNAAAYIEAAIESVLAQRGVSFEFLIGDAGSTDGTWLRIERYRKEPRVRAWRWRVRCNSAAARNRLIRRSVGEYISICDNDDRMLPGNLRALAAFLDRRPEVGVVYGRLRLMDVRGRMLPQRPTYPGPHRAWDLLVNVVPHPGTMIRRELFDRVGGYRESFPPVEDYDLFLRLAEVTWFKQLPRETYAWRQRTDSQTRGSPLVEVLRNRAVARREAIGRRYGIHTSW